MSRFNDTTPGELAIVSAQMRLIREELMNHADHACQGAGFQERDVRCVAMMGSLLGAAQLAALSDRGGFRMYKMFQNMCLAMAQSSAAEAVRGSVGDIGNDMHNGGIIL